MLRLGLFKRRNFAVGNTQTFTMYGGLGITFFLLVVYLQEVAGYRALAAGLALTPSTIVMFLLSKRMGRLANRYGPRLFMGFGPLFAAAGLTLMLRLAHTSTTSPTCCPRCWCSRSGCPARSLRSSPRFCPMPRSPTPGSPPA